MVTQADFRPAREFAKSYGVKAIVYGPPGSGKTPIVNTAPRPAFLAVEPGLLSMRGSSTPTYVAPTWKEIQGWFDWLFGSREAANYDTAAVDSISQMCEIHLRDNPRKVSHGLQSYGKMAEDVGDLLHKLYYMKNKHTYLICKQSVENTDNGSKKRPYFPGNDLNVKVPHLFDEVLQLDMFAIPGHGTTRAFQTGNSFDSYCRDRTGLLAQFEPPDLSALFNKCMSNGN